jgi:hypothetical protein
MEYMFGLKRKKKDRMKVKMIKFKAVSSVLCVASLIGCGETRNSNADIEKITASLAEQQCAVANDNMVETLNVEEDGFKIVDMGLSVKWASCNLGASKSEQPGNYYAWGELNKKANYNANNSATYSYSLTELRSKKVIDSNNILLPTKDAATIKLGKNWRMPTREEAEELIKKCKWEWGLKNGVKGYKVTGPNGKSIFLPAKGYFFGSQLYDTDETGNYWTSTGYDNGNFSYALDFSRRRPKVASSGRSGGRCIRPVCEK